MKPCNEMIEKALDLVEHMTRLADAGDAVREDDGCGVLYGIIRDAAFKIRRVAEQERDAHVRKGWWSMEGSAARGSGPSERSRSSTGTPPGKLNP